MNATHTVRDPAMIHQIGTRRFDFTREVVVMAIINRTPDSFHDAGSTFALKTAVTRAVQAADIGAGWVDVGGVPFGRGVQVSTEAEIERVVPLITAIATRRPDVVISVDTHKADVARAAVDAGASVVNDTSGLADPKMAAVVAETGAHIVITHSVGPPRQEKPAAHFADVVAEVRRFLLERVDRAEAAGIPRDRIIVDPGHDLDKNTLHSLEITRRLTEFASLGLPLLVAVSHKDFIGEAIDRPRGELLAGTLAAMTACIWQGARIVRMHDIQAAVDAARMTAAMLGMRPPARLAHNTHPTRNV